MRSSKTWILRCALVAVVLSIFPTAFGGDTGQEASVMQQEADAKIQALFDAPAGVFDLEYDDEGNLRRLKIKGEAEVSTALGASRADRQARDKAQRDAKASFSKFLNERVTVIETETEGFLIQERNGEESADFLNASGKVTTLYSNAALRGLIVLLDQVDGVGQERKATVVYGWSAKLTDAALRAQEDMSRKPSPVAAPAKQAAPSESSRSNAGVVRIGNVNDF